MDIVQILSDPASYAGMTVEVSGIFMMNSKLAYLAPDRDARISECIQILHADLRKHIAQVPGFVGGKFAFHDEARISGKLLPSRSGSAFRVSMEPLEMIIRRPASEVTAEKLYTVDFTKAWPAARMRQLEM